MHWANINHSFLLPQTQNLHGDAWLKLNVTLQDGGPGPTRDTRPITSGGTMWQTNATTGAERLKVKVR